ncbi:hypothetical protein GCM10007920_11930 [Ciceribacter naphthalenivorans]|uniref:Uncharacterized protein n=3 Tax=Pseudomonadota TaxID=1224 RepID=A0A512HL88_9HYPH|nr:hypothetical protein RNA01_31470 [Ciceribacter naphthalenivorans]GLR21407.1 hypothetical protein GCM10007920_11930 [Ciceribacter naphthalenivorans]GLT04263.1 hypothetical protein GCM10007926_11930 [Sphingomonas psychrolutea]
MMAKIPEMTKHRGFPSGLTGTQWQFTIRRANPKVTKITAWPRHPSRDQTEALADAAFLHAAWHYFGAEPFERGNLDGGRLCRLFGREIIPAEKAFDPASYQAMLQINESLARKNFPQAFEDIMEV